MESQQGDLEVVEMPEDCGNAPRKMVIRDFLIALYRGDVDAVTSALQADVQWEIVGASHLDGADEVQAWASQQPRGSQLQVATVITHGTDCGADGTVVHPDGSATRFSHILIFAGHSKNAKIKRLRSYLIAT